MPPPFSWFPRAPRTARAQRPALPRVMVTWCRRSIYRSCREHSSPSRAAETSPSQKHTLVTEATGTLDFLTRHGAPSFPDGPGGFPRTLAPACRPNAAVPASSRSSLRKGGEGESTDRQREKGPLHLSVLLPSPGPPQALRALHHAAVCRPARGLEAHPLV